MSLIQVTLIQVTGTSGAQKETGRSSFCYSHPYLTCLGILEGHDSAPQCEQGIPVGTMSGGAYGVGRTWMKVHVRPFFLCG